MLPPLMAEVGLPEATRYTPPSAPHKSLEQLFGECRPKLHRYCARMTGSVVDGEDVVQEAILKAMQTSVEMIVNPEAWLFRIAHNAAVDFVRRRTREQVLRDDKDFDMIAAEVNTIEHRQLAATSLRTFMHLPARQRSSVILSDVLGHSLQEIGDIVGSSVPAVKASLQRGRERLRELAASPEEALAPKLAEPERSRLLIYVDRFNAHDFDAVRALLAEDVQLEIVNRLHLDGKRSVTPYFTNYAARPHWRFKAGFVDKYPAMLVVDADDPSQPVKYFVLLAWNDKSIISIRDFVFARYALEGAQLTYIK